MFGIGSWEFIVIVALALLLFGPDKLPEFARTIGRFTRDFKRYQAMMESTIRAEVFTADPKLQKDPFKTGKEFAEKVGSGGFVRPGKAAGETGASSEPSVGAAEPSTVAAAPASSADPSRGEKAAASQPPPVMPKPGVPDGSSPDAEGGSAQA